MKAFEIIFVETVTYSVIIEAKSMEKAKTIFHNGDWENSEALYSVFEGIEDIKEMENIK